MVASKKPFGPLSLKCHLGHSHHAIENPSLMSHLRSTSSQIPWAGTMSHLHVPTNTQIQHQNLEILHKKKGIMWPFFVIQYVASLSFNPTILMEGNIEMKHLHTLPLQFLWCTKNATLGVIRILQKHPPKDPHPPAAANPFKTNEFQAAEPNLKAWLVSGSRASVLTQALSNLTILPAAETFNGGSSWCLDAYSGV